MKRRRKDKGISLIEVLIATIILLLGLLIVASSFLAMARANRYSERQDKAVQLASRVMEDLRSRKFPQVQNEEGNYGEYADFPDYRHRVEVTPTGQVKRVTVRVFFENDRRQVVLVSFFANM
ncbi:MAG: prepilin-type N-terminal cleavage/methylation domain-containing protein [bacterium]